MRTGGSLGETIDNHVTITSNPIEIPCPTLADLMREGLDVVFVGINPAIYSVQRGHYFARSTNRFWPCLSRSILSRAAREALSVEKLGPEHDRAFLDHGIGFTDLVKRATPKASDLAQSECYGCPARLGKALPVPTPRRALPRCHRVSPRSSGAHGGGSRGQPWPPGITHGTDSGLSRPQPERGQCPLHPE